MEVLDNHFPAGGGGDRVGISEIAFTNTIPEPGSVLLLGVGLVGCLVTRLCRS